MFSDYYDDDALYNSYEFTLFMVYIVCNCMNLIMCIQLAVIGEQIKFESLK